jgi:hypothetical protein
LREIYVKKSQQEEKEIYIRELFIDLIYQAYPSAVAPYGVSSIFNDVYLPTFRLDRLSTRAW